MLSETEKKVAFSTSALPRSYVTSGVLIEAPLSATDILCQGQLQVGFHFIQCMNF